MDLLKIKIPNKEKELLDVLIEGNENSSVTIVFVHGFAANKHWDYFDTAAEEFSKEYRIVRFDFSGCGKSQGKLEDKNFIKWSEDLNVILNFIKNKYQGKIFLIAHSMGVFVTSLLSPNNIFKSVFTGTPNSNINYIIDFLTKSALSRKGGRINYKGISIFPRSFGEIQKIGPSFWEALKSFKPVEKITEFSKKTDLLMIHMKQDKIIGGKFLNEYSLIPNIKIKWLNGDHSFTKQEDRKILIQEIKNFLQ